MTYFHEIIFTTALLIWCLTLVDPLLLNLDYSHHNISQFLFCAMCLCVLYIFEMIYRLEMRWQLLVHHCVRK